MPNYHDYVSKFLSSNDIKQLYQANKSKNSSVKKCWCLRNCHKMLATCLDLSSFYNCLARD
jgi:hypothetical protein